MIEVRSRPGAEVFVCDGPWAAISISTKPDDWPVLSETNRVDLLQLHFYDVDFPDYDGKIPNNIFDRDRGSRILHFVEEVWGKVDCLLVHCEAGISRSAGVAAAIDKIKNNTDEKWFKPPYFPNRLVYRTILNLHHERF